MHITRRLLLSGCVSLALPVAACGTLSQQQATQLQSLIAGAQSIQASVMSAAPQVLALLPIGSADRVNATAAIGGLAAAVNGLAGVSTIAAGATYVQAIETALNTVVSAAATIPVIPEPYHTALIVAALALPPVETLVGLTVQQGTALAATIKARKVAAAPTATVSP